MHEILQYILDNQNPDASFGDTRRERKAFSALFISVLCQMAHGPVDRIGRDRRGPFERLSEALAFVRNEPTPGELKLYDAWDWGLIADAIHKHKKHFTEAGDEHALASFVQAFQDTVRSPNKDSAWAGAGPLARAARIARAIGREDLVDVAIRGIEAYWAGTHFKGESDKEDWKDIFHTAEVVQLMRELDPPTLRPFREQSLRYLRDKARPDAYGKYWRASSDTETLILTTNTLLALVMIGSNTDAALIQEGLSYLLTMRELGGPDGLGVESSILLLATLTKLHEDVCFLALIRATNARPRASPVKGQTRPASVANKRYQLLKHLALHAAPEVASSWRTAPKPVTQEALRALLGYSHVSGVCNLLKNLMLKDLVREHEHPEREHGGRPVKVYSITEKGLLEVTKAEQAKVGSTFSPS